MSHSTQRGFTLIELLVVMAIIGILSGIVVLAIGNMRALAADSGIKGNLDGIRKQAELYAVDTGSYGAQATSSDSALDCSEVSGGMWGNANIKQAVREAEKHAGVLTSGGIGGNIGLKSTCGATSNSWAVAVVLRSDLNQVWCIDSRGRANVMLRSRIDDVTDTFNGCTHNP